MAANLAQLERFAKEPALQREALDRVGAFYASASRRSFRDQQFGSQPWPARYPDQAEPKINVAGALRDFESGRKAPLARRFADRPALVDTGALRRSIAYRVIGSGDGLAVEVGTTVSYAVLQQFGGRVVIDIGDDGRELLAQWLDTAAGIPYRPHLRKYRWEVYRSSVLPRRFIGTTPELQRQASAIVRRYIETIPTEAA